MCTGPRSSPSSIAAMPRRFDSAMVRMLFMRGLVQYGSMTQ
jgi:hypothetical protein